MLCWLLGHTPPTYRGSVAYGRVSGRGKDGCGCEHAVVYAECDRCQKEYLVIRIHLPKAGDA